MERLISGKQLRFVTFTLRHSRTPLIDQRKRLKRSFALLRRKEPWKAAVHGGIVFSELKVGERDGLWHPHLHCIVEGTWIDQRELSKAWHAVTGDSSIVDVRAVEQNEYAARYVTKYVTKPIHDSVYQSTELTDEALIALKGDRLYQTFGTWHGVDLEAESEDKTTWKPIASLSSLRTSATAGDEHAARLIDIIQIRWPWASPVIAALPPNRTLHATEPRPPP